MRAAWTAPALAWALLVLPARVHGDGAAAAPEQLLTARGLRAPELARMAAQLGAKAGERRAAAFHALCELNAESLPGIEERLRELRAERPHPDLAKAAIAAFRHATGSRRADDEIDLAPGVLPALRARRDRAILAMAEPLLYVRALERIGGREAGAVMAQVLLLDERGVWDHELKLARTRAGMRLLPALLELRSHDDARVRGWALAGVQALGMEDPRAAALIPDAHLLAQVLQAYSQPLDFAAMPVVVRLVAADKAQVRLAARAAVARFGKNAIWQLRELYAELTGQSADKSWDHERTARELYAVLDRPAIEEAQTLLARGMKHYVAGELDAMQRLYDRVLAQYPQFEDRGKMAPGYAALGRALLARDRLEPARDAFQRALRLDPQAPDAAKLRAEVAFVDAELALVSGVVDLDGYGAALRHDPDHAAAAAAHDRLSGERAARARKYRRIAAAGAIGLLLLWIAALLRGRRPLARGQSTG
jgi:tetratricopeptide (TPR) repeat protein